MAMEKNGAPGIQPLSPLLAPLALALAGSGSISTAEFELLAERLRPRKARASACAPPAA